MIVDLYSRKALHPAYCRDRTVDLSASRPIANQLTKIDAVTLGKIEVLCLRDGISVARFMSIAVDAYALVLPGLSPQGE